MGPTKINYYNLFDWTIQTLKVLWYHFTSQVSLLFTALSHWYSHIICSKYPYHAATILDLKWGWMGIKIAKMVNDHRCIPLCDNGKHYNSGKDLSFFIIVTHLILTFWLVLVYDLLEDRRIDDYSTQFNFFLIFLILNLNQSQFFAKHSNQSVRFIFYRH